MKKMISAIMCIMMILSCHNEKREIKSNTVIETSSIEGTWKLVYAETKEQDSVQIRDIATSDFIKIINETHFAFFNHDYNDASLFYGAGGTYTIQGNQYIESLKYTAWDDYRNHDFPFTFELKGDSLIQFGIEEIKEKNIKKYIVEKYIKIK